jgi:hypothetical protein
VPARRPAAPRRRRANGDGESRSSAYYDVTMRGTFEVRMSRIRSNNQTNAEKSARVTLEEYARDACQGDNDLAITGTDTKKHTRKVEMNIKVDLTDVEKAKEFIATLGDKVQVTDAYLEHVGRY